MERARRGPKFFARTSLAWNKGSVNLRTQVACRPSSLCTTPKHIIIRVLHHLPLRVRRKVNHSLLLIPHSLLVSPDHWWFPKVTPIFADTDSPHECWNHLPVSSLKDNYPHVDHVSRSLHLLLRGPSMNFFISLGSFSLLWSSLRCCKSQNYQ
jgi:hypothetical protein